MRQLPVCFSSEVCGTLRYQCNMAYTFRRSRAQLPLIDPLFAVPITRWLSASDPLATRWRPAGRPLFLRRPPAGFLPVCGKHQSVGNESSAALARIEQTLLGWSEPSRNGEAHQYRSGELSGAPGRSRSGSGGRWAVDDGGMCPVVMSGTVGIN